MKTKYISVIRAFGQMFARTIYAGVFMMIAPSMPAQNLFASDYLTGNVYEYTPGGVQSTFASGLSFPMFLAFNSAGNLFVSTWGDGYIYEFTPGGARSTFASGLSYPSGLAFDSAGTLFVMDDTTEIYKYTPDGTQIIVASGLNDPYGLAPQIVPEPSALGLTAVGATVLFGRRTIIAALTRGLSR